MCGALVWAFHITKSTCNPFRAGRPCAGCMRRPRPRYLSATSSQTGPGSRRQALGKLPESPHRPESQPSPGLHSASPPLGKKAWVDDGPQGADRGAGVAAGPEAAVPWRCPLVLAAPPGERRLGTLHRCAIHSLLRICPVFSPCPASSIAFSSVFFCLLRRWIFPGDKQCSLSLFTSVPHKGRAFTNDSSIDLPLHDFSAIVTYLPLCFQQSRWQHVPKQRRSRVAPRAGPAQEKRGRPRAGLGQRRGRGAFSHSASAFRGRRWGKVTFRAVREKNKDF